MSLKRDLEKVADLMKQAIALQAEAMARLASGDAYAAEGHATAAQELLGSAVSKLRCSIERSEERTTKRSRFGHELYRVKVNGRWSWVSAGDGS